MSASSPWTPENNERLRELFKQGLTASQSAKALGSPFTRQAVVSKWHRMNLRRYHKDGVTLSNHVPRRAGVVEATASASAKVDTALARVEAMQPGPFAKPWAERKAFECAWPHGLPGAVMSCCAPTCGTYCEEHRNVMRRGAK